MLNWERCWSLVMPLKPGLSSRHMSFHPPPWAVGPLQLEMDRLATTWRNRGHAVLAALRRAQRGTARRHGRDRGQETYIFHHAVPPAHRVGAHAPRVAEVLAHGAVPRVPAAQGKPNRAACGVEGVPHFAVVVKGLQREQDS